MRTLRGGSVRWYCPFLLGLAVAAAGVLEARPAEARLVDLYAGAQAGGLTGWGSTAKTPDFFDKTRGPAIGFDLGVKLLVFDVSANFLQVVDGSGFEGTLIQLLLGVGFDVPGSLFGSSRSVLRPELAGGFGFGTPGPVSPPLTDSQIAAKGVVANASLGYEYFLNPFIGVGATAAYGWHYFFGGDVVNSSDAARHSSGYHFYGVGTVTFHLGY
jgi:hypothetical protein